MYHYIELLYKLTVEPAFIVSSRYMFLLSQAFDVVEKSYFETIDDALAEKAHLSNYLPPHSEVLIHTNTQSVGNTGRLRRTFRRGGFEPSEKTDLWYVLR